MSAGLEHRVRLASRRATVLYFPVVGVLFVVSTVTGITLGAADIGLETILRALVPGFLVEEGGSPDQLAEAHRVIISQIRLPRILVAALAGCALAVAGLLVQAVFRNPLAEPTVIGASQGAALGAVVAFITDLAMWSPLGLPVLAFSGALIALFTVYALASRAGKTSVATLLLAGIAFGALMSALTSLLISLNFVNWQVASEIVFWMMGGLDARSWTHVWLALPLVALGASVAVWYVRDLDLMLLGEDASASLGLEVESSRWAILGAAALLTGAAVSVSGVVGFVGLIVPHVVRILLGPAHRTLLPASMLTGAVFLMVCDILARTVHPSSELRLGVVTAMFGAPLFLYLLRRRRMEVSIL